jgi:hypothetical protein
MDVTDGELSIAEFAIFLFVIDQGQVSFMDDKEPGGSPDHQRQQVDRNDVISRLPDNRLQDAKTPSTPASMR